MKKVFSIFSIILFYPALALAHYGDDYFSHHNMSSMMGEGGGYYWGGGILMIAFWVLVVIGIVYLVKYLSGASSGKEKNNDKALDILRERYARGEIKKEEFEQKKKELR